MNRSREIKFRAWHKRLNQMFFVYSIDWKHGLVYCQGENGNTHTFGFIDMELREFTGLKDKDGKEIYEGDIVAVDCDCDPGDYAYCTHPPLITYAGWFKDNASYELRTADAKLSDMEFSDDYQDVYEVIGNIYEHPHLLEEPSHA